MILNSPIISGSLTVTGNIITSGSITISGSIASASYASNAELLDGLDATVFTLTSSFNTTSASLYTVSSSAYVTSGSLSATSASLSATSGSLSATSGSLSATSGSLSTASGSFNTRVTALEVTGSALSSSLLTVSGSGYATSASLSTASGSFDSRVATIESKYATTGSNTFIGTQVVSGSILQSGSFTTTGTIIAQTINVQTVTSSVVYSSGSNVFGNDIGNSQRFTGSVLITGSLTIAGASSATSYSGTTIFGSTIACSPIGCFATSCATSFIGGTLSGTTIYGSTAVCSAVGKFTSCIDAGSGTFSSTVTAAGTGGRSVVLTGLSTGQVAINGDNSTYATSIVFNNQAGGTTLTGIWAYGSGATLNWLGLGGTAYNGASIYLLPSGNVGIGVDAPAYTLDVNKCVASNFVARIANPSSTGYGLYIQANDNTKAGIRIANASGGTAIDLFGSGAATFTSTITGTTIYGSTAVCSAVGLFSGCIGIGTTSPSSPLSICGTFNGNTPFICMTGTGTGVYQRVITAINTGMNVGDDLTIQMGTALSCRNVGQLNYHHEGAGCATNRMSIGLYGVDDVFNVTGNGFVGIGTTSPGDLLHIEKCQAGGMGMIIRNSCGATSNTSMCSLISLQLVGAGQTGQIGVNLIAGKEGDYSSGGTRNAFFAIQTACGDNLYERLRITSTGQIFMGAQSALFNSLLNINYNQSNYEGLAISTDKIYNGTPQPNLIFGGKYNSSGDYRQFATIQAYKDNITSGDSSASLVFYTNANGASVSERMRITAAGPIIFSNTACINGAGYGLQFTGGNNRIYFGACRAIEGSTSGTSLQLGEHYTKLSLQAHGQFSCGADGGSPKLFFGQEGPESAGAKAIYLESYWMILQPHYNEGFRIRAVNASGTQRTLAEFYGSGEVYFNNMAAAAGTYNVKWTSGGRITYDTSSCRYKSNIRNSVYGLCDILKLNSRMFEYKDGGRTDVGLIAEEVNQVIPELAIKNPEGQPDAVSYDRMVSVLIKAIQEQQCKIALLESCLGIS